MKKLLLFFGLFLMTFAVMYGQDSSQENIPWSEHPVLRDYTVQFRSINATCYNNGRVEFAICDGSGSPIDSVTFASLNLSDLYIAHRGVVLDTTIHRTPVQYTFPWASVPMETGDFEVTLECIHKEGDGSLVAVEAVTQLEVELDYTVPTISPLTVRSTDGQMLGNIASLDCDSTGRVQVKITGGRFPYTVRVVNHNDPTDTLPTVVFDTNQHFGTNVSRADYLDYYTFYNMPAGEWDYYLTDGCGYEMPRATQMVDQIAPPLLDHIGVYASSGNGADSNRLKLKVYLGTDYAYYIQMFKPYMQYRFLVPADGDRPVLASEDTTANPWIDFPTANSNGEATVALNIEKAEDYCDLMYRDLIFQLRLKPNGVCEPYVMNDTFHYNKPQKFIMENEYVEYDRDLGGECGGVTIYRRTDNFSIRYQIDEPNYVSPYDDDAVRRYHFTYPIVWEYRDASNTIIKMDTLTSSIADKSTLSVSDFPGRTPPFQETVYMRLVDAHGCELYTRSRVINVTTNTQSAGSPQWKTTVKDPVCGSDLRSIQVYEEFGSETASYDSLTIRLSSSPDNVYNFTAVYHASTHEWTVTKDRIDNMATIGWSPDGTSITISKNGLPPGTYIFDISHAPCVGSTTVKGYLGGLDSVKVQVAPEFQIVNNCSDKFIKFTAGQIVKETRYRPADDNGPLLKKTVPLKTVFRLVGGPVGGYDQNDSHTYIVGDSVRISVPTGTDNPYIIKFYPDVNLSSLCQNAEFYDTIYYNGSTVMFDFAMALLCNVGDSIGTAYVKAWNGNPPYRYQLYSEPDLNGVLLGDVTLPADSVAIFKNKKMNTDVSLSCRVEDACGAAFPINFYPQTLADLQKTWFDGGLQAITTCEGSTINVHALRVGNIFQYQWFKNDETEPFSVSSEPSLFIPRGADTAVYHVKIYQTGCDDVIEDSVTLYPKVSPSLKIEDVDPVCPGQDVTLSFIPKVEWGDTVFFTVVMENSEGTITRSYHANRGDTIRDVFSTNSEAIVYPILVQDEDCGYPLPSYGDTMYIQISNHIINPCQIITEYDTVCYGDDAMLSAYCTAEPPLTIRWYSDFEMNELLDEFTAYDTNEVSYHPLDGLQERTIRYVNVTKEDWCPSVNNSPNNVVDMTHSGETRMTCTDAYLFFDDGGEDGKYSVGDESANSKHVFINTENDHPLTIHFDKLELANTSYLLFFSSAEPLVDHLICSVSSYDEIPDIIVSPNDTLMVYFIPGEENSAGWRAIVQPAPGIAIADVVNPVVNHYYDRVCQSQNNTYNNSEIIGLNITTADTLTASMRESGTYIFSQTGSTAMGCDSSAILTLMVSSAPMKEILRVTTNQIGYHWHDSVYYEAGVHVYNIPDSRGCDYLDVLNLIVIEVTTKDKDVCYGDSTVIGLDVVTNDSVKPKSNLIKERHSVGDVLCRKGIEYKIFRPDDFLNDKRDSGWVAYGVVAYVDPNDNDHGKAISLVDARPETNLVWAKQNYSSSVHSLSKRGNWLSQREDMDGKTNTSSIQSTAANTNTSIQSSEAFKEAAPAAYYCYYYDPVTMGTGGANNEWYLPSCGEWLICFAYRTIINTTLEKLSVVGATTLVGGKDDNYWTSTEKDDGIAICMNGKGQIIQHLKKYDSTHTFRIRAMYNF